jgi:hypothetical protein
LQVRVTAGRGRFQGARIVGKSIRSRIEELEAGIPKAIVLTLSDGTEYKHDGPASKFYSDALKQIDEGRGPLRAAVRDTVKAKGCGLLHQLLQAILHSVDDLKASESLGVTQ